MHAVRCEKAVVDALAQAVRVERVAEIAVRVAVVVAEWRSRHADLERGGEVIENFTPIAVVACAAPVTLVHDDQVEEIGATSRKRPDGRSSVAMA